MCFRTGIPGSAGARPRTDVITDPGCENFCSSGREHISTGFILTVKFSIHTLINFMVVVFFKLFPIHYFIEKMKLTSIVFVLILTTLAGKAAFAQEKEEKIKWAPNPEMIPPDFDPNKHILLVLQLSKRNDPEKIHAAGTKDIDAAFKANYDGYRYEIVSPADLRDANSKYKDTSVYRFVLCNSATRIGREDGGYRLRTDASTGMTMRTPNTPSRVAQTIIDFYFHDRATNEDYVTSGRPTSFIKMTLRPIILTMAQHGRKKKAA